MNSWFRAVSREPKRRRGTTVASSEIFKWLLKDDPPTGDALYAAQVRRLADRLVAAGWEPVGKGRHWYELRFVWRHEGAPPETLDPDPAEASR